MLWNNGQWTASCQSTQLGREIRLASQIHMTTRHPTIRCQTCNFMHGQCNVNITHYKRHYFDAFTVSTSGPEADWEMYMLAYDAVIYAGLHVRHLDSIAGHGIQDTAWYLHILHTVFIDPEPAWCGWHGCVVSCHDLVMFRVLRGLKACSLNQQIRKDWQRKVQIQTQMLLKVQRQSAACCITLAVCIDGDIVSHSTANLCGMQQSIEQCTTEQARDTCCRPHYMWTLKHLMSAVTRFYMTRVNHRCANSLHPLVLTDLCLFYVLSKSCAQALRTYRWAAALTSSTTYQLISQPADK